MCVLITCVYVLNTPVGLALEPTLTSTIPHSHPPLHTRSEFQSVTWFEPRHRHASAIALPTYLPPGA
ncbi:hypothetical protein RSAG8_05863, partial [Rhizoctonia solani AG-8 WAC10335]